MATPSLLATNLLLIALSAITVVEPTTESHCECQQLPINGGSFPEGFVFGAASSAYQVFSVA